MARGGAMMKRKKVTLKGGTAGMTLAKIRAAKAKGYKLVKIS